MVGRSGGAAEAVAAEHGVGEVVGADREEVGRGGDRGGVGHRGGGLDHGAEGGRRGEGGPHGGDLLRRLDHRQQDAQLGVAAGVGDRPQLGAQRVGVGEQQLEPALAGAGEERRGLVGAEVEHPDGGGAALERAEHRCERGAVLRLGRPLGRLEERELRPQQPDALGAGGQAGVELGAGGGVDEDPDAVAVARDGGERAVGERALALGPAGLLRRGGGVGARRGGGHVRDPLPPSTTIGLPGAAPSTSSPSPTTIGSPSPRATTAA